MNTKKILIKEIDKLPEPMIAEVLDFVRFLEYKREIDVEAYIQSESASSTITQSETKTPI